MKIPVCVCAACVCVCLCSVITSTHNSCQSSPAHPCPGTEAQQAMNYGAYPPNVQPQTATPRVNLIS